jgi:hypothetical protein
LGLTFSTGGFGGFNLPIMLGLEGGVGSTYNSTSNHGTFLNFGVEINKMPLAVSEESSDPVDEVKTSWVQPVIATGFRFWNKNNKLREINLKYGFGAASDPKPAATSSTDIVEKYYKPMTIRLSFLYFINY